MSTFYNIERHTIDDRRKIIEEAIVSSFSWCVDILDCTKSFSRSSIDSWTAKIPSIAFGTVDDDRIRSIMDKYEDGCHTFFIDRQGYGHFLDKTSFEIGFSTMSGPNQPDYFLFIHVQPFLARLIADKWKLKART